MKTSRAKNNAENDGVYLKNDYDKTTCEWLGWHAQVRLIVKELEESWSSKIALWMETYKL